jgi:proteasome lid subunit RPN8/RPN11
MAETIQSRIKIHSSQDTTSPEIPMEDVPLLGSQDRLGAYESWTSHKCTGEKDEARACEVVMLQSVYRKVVDHLTRDTTREHGGFLLGYESTLSDSHAPSVVVTDAIAANHTEGTAVRLTFTNETWRDLDDQIAEKYAATQPAPERIGWYHSHPNISIFLSHWDLDVCTTYGRRKHPVALVVDPIVRRGGFFIGGPKGYDARAPQGFWEVHDLQSESVVDWINTKASVESNTAGAPKALRVRVRVPKDRIRLVIRTTALGIFAIFLLVALGYLAVVQQSDRRRIQALTDQVTQLQAESHSVVLQAPDIGTVVAAPSDQPQSEPSTASGLSVRVTPRTASVNPAGSVQFVANIIGTNVDRKKGVRWTIDPREGKISKDGTYTAPVKPSNTTITVIATSNADPLQAGRATVTLAAAQKQSTTTGNSPKITGRPDTKSATDKTTAASSDNLRTSGQESMSGASIQGHDAAAQPSQNKTTTSSQVSNPVTAQDAPKTTSSSESTGEAGQQDNKSGSVGGNSKATTQEQKKSEAGSDANGSQNKPSQPKNDATNQTSNSDKPGPQM